MTLKHEVFKIRDLPRNEQDSLRQEGVPLHRGRGLLRPDAAAKILVGRQLVCLLWDAIKMRPVKKCLRVDDPSAQNFLKIQLPM
jgi:hypothetical protein